MQEGSGFYHQVDISQYIISFKLENALPGVTKSKLRSPPKAKLGKEKVGCSHF